MRYGLRQLRMLWSWRDGESKRGASRARSASERRRRASGAHDQCAECSGSLARAASILGRAREQCAARRGEVPRELSRRPDNFATLPRLLFIHPSTTHTLGPAAIASQLQRCTYRRETGSTDAVWSAYHRAPARSTPPHLARTGPLAAALLRSWSRGLHRSVLPSTIPCHLHRLRS